MIKEISYEECLPVWNKLWADRKTKIEPISFMKFPTIVNNSYDYTEREKISSPIFLGYFDGQILIGVNSLHTVEDTTRSRGLFVFPQYRNQGIGNSLLKKTIDLATGKFIWSFPKKEALNTYLSVGFELASEPIYDSLECKTNFYVKKYL
jgi:GNAT superfamily N-acetyltransferase